MPRPTSSSTKAIDKAWADAFKNAIFRSNQPVGEGWKTYDELKQQFNYGKNRTHNLICKLVREGLLDKFEGTRHNGKRAVRQVWYRPSALAKGKPVKVA